jgi:predicted AlkP superfamily phosphohydrolase/phosphomutase
MSTKKNTDAQYSLDRRDFLRISAGGAAAVAGAGVGLGATGCSSGSTTNKKVIVLGLDGLSPRIVRKMWEDPNLPDLPNMKKLAQMGHFGPLQTTMPALSPVAWSSFITGMSPGGHGIADFIMRDPETYTPVFSIYESRDIDMSLDLGQYSLPLSGGGMYNLRHGTPFWSYLTERGIPAHITKIPTNFPVEESATTAISGMGTPAVTDTYGNFAYFTTNLMERYNNLSGGNVFHVDRDGHRVDCELPGPTNPYLKFDETKLDDDEFYFNVKVPFTVHCDTNNQAVRIDIQDKSIVVKQGEFSEWVNLNFDFGAVFGSSSGIVRFMLKEAHPFLRLYVTPINIDPANQAAPVTWPAEYGAELADEIGPFFTKMLPADNKAFEAHIFSDEDYVSMSQIIMQERVALFNYELSKFKSGLFYFYVSSTDQDTHMLWRNMDETHPMHHASDTRFSQYVYYMYEEMDKLVGQLLPAVDDNTLLMVCSDHGFEQFGRQFHLNSWLRREGYLTIKPEARSKSRTSIFDVDWENTIAYGIGFNGLYINRKGREGQGIIPDDQVDKYTRELTTKLTGITDDETGRVAISRVFDRNEVYHGSYTPDMPELLVGYEPGYRNSSDSVQGMTQQTIIDVNPFAWSGDHSMNRDKVPGSLMLSQKISKQMPSIMDLPVTILEFFGIERPEQMDGRSIFKA